MPKYILYRQYLVPVTSYAAVEADTAQDACRLAIEEHETYSWENGETNWEDSFGHCVLEIIEVTDDRVWNSARTDEHKMGEVLLDGTLDDEPCEDAIEGIDIPEEFANPCADCERAATA